MDDPSAPQEPPAGLPPELEYVPSLGPSLRVRKTRPRPGLLRRRLFALLVLAVLLGGIGVGAAMAIRSLFPPATIELGADAGGRILVLVIGVDPKALPSDESDKVTRRQADSLHVIGLDPLGHRAWILTIPRETRAMLGEVGTGILGDALAIGGIPLLKDTVEELTGLTVPHYVRLDLDGARAITAELGPTELYLPKPLKVAQPEFGIALDAPAGWQTLSPDGVLAYSYERTKDDFERLARQQVLMQLWQEKIHSGWSTWWWFTRLASRSVGAVESDLPKRDFELLASAWREVAPADLTFATLPGEFNRHGEWLLNPKRWETLLPKLQKAPGTKAPAEARASVEILYDDPGDERVMMLATTLTNQGFQVIRTARHPVRQDETVLLDRVRADERSQAVIAALDTAVGGARVEVRADEGVGYGAQYTLALGKRFFAK